MNSMNKPLRFGIEEEYFITDLDTRRMSGQPPGASIEACKQVMGDCFAYEMFQGQIEVASPSSPALRKPRSTLSLLAKDCGVNSNLLAWDCSAPGAIRWPTGVRNRPPSKIIFFNCLKTTSAWLGVACYPVCTYMLKLPGTWTAFT